MIGPGDLGVSQETWLALLVALRTRAIFDVQVELLTLSGTRVRWLRTVVDGQVEAKGVNRSCSVTLADPGRSLRQVEGANARHFLAKVLYRVTVGGGWVEVPVFTGVIGKADRTGPQVVLSCAGKSRIANHTAGQTFTVPKGTLKTDAIKQILVNLTGEDRSKVDIPDRPSRLRDTLTVLPEQSPWKRCLGLADEFDPPLTLAYNGLGVVKGRPASKSANFTMGTETDDRKGWLTAEPTKSHDFRGLVNRYILHFGGKDTRPAVAELPPKHPNSAQSLARNGVPQWHEVVAHSGAIKTRATAARVAKDRLDRAQVDTVTVQAECFPFPFLEAGDRLRIESQDVTSSPVIDMWTLPLAGGNMMTLGWTDVRSL